MTSSTMGRMCDLQALDHAAAEHDHLGIEQLANLQAGQAEDLRGPGHDFPRTSSSFSSKDQAEHDCCGWTPGP